MGRFYGLYCKKGLSVSIRLGGLPRFSFDALDVFPGANGEEGADHKYDGKCDEIFEGGANGYHDEFLSFEGMEIDESGNRAMRQLGSAG
jgi:hypothetical protein